MTECFVGLVIVGVIAFIGFAVWDHYDASFVHEGAIVSRNHSAAWTEIRHHTHSDGHGHTYSTTVPIYHPERWYIVIEGVGRNEKVRQRCIDVPQNYWATLQVGQHYVAEATEE
jgi:hypothetical protein